MLLLLTLTTLAAATPFPRGLASTTDANMTNFQQQTVDSSLGGHATCVSGFVQVMASATNFKYNVNMPANQSDATQVFVDAVTGSTGTQFVSGTQDVSGTYDIGVTLCMPVNGTSSNTVQLLSHGVGFDRSYWNFAPGYSYVDFAAQLGHTTFFYDRLGVGVSSKADPLTDLQSPLQVEILAQLAGGLRNGTYGPSFDQIVGVGHSYGSALTQGVTSQYPDLFDAAVITGLSVNSSGQNDFSVGNNWQIASENQPDRFSTLNNGYLVSASTISNQIAFFHSPGFDGSIASLADATKGTIGIVEIFSLPAVIKPAGNFTKPVTWVNGNEDLPFCNGNCTYPMNLVDGALSMLYPAASANSTFLVPNTGHGINLHYSAPQAFAFIQNSLQSNGF